MDHHLYPRISDPNKQSGNRILPEYSAFVWVEKELLNGKCQEVRTRQLKV